MKAANQTTMLRPRSSNTFRPGLPTLTHAGSFGHCSGFRSFIWLLPAVCIYLVSEGTSTMAATTVENQEATVVDLDNLLDAAVVTLVAGESQLVAHRAVLAAGSPLFATMFAHDPLEASSSEFIIRDMEFPVLRKLVAFIYSGRVPQLHGMAMQLLVAANKYGVPALKNACEQQLVEQLTMDNAVSRAVLAIRHNCSTLRQAAVAFIRSHISQTMAKDVWVEAVLTYPGTAVELTRLFGEPPSDISAPAIAGSEATPTTQPPSNDDQTPAVATSPTVYDHSPALDEEAVSRLRSLSGQEKGSRLLLAAKAGAVEKVRALLIALADVGARDDSGWTALHYAADMGRVEVARCLLQAGAEVGARDRLRYTPLHVAAVRGKTDVVRLLLAASADVKDRISLGWTALHLAAWGGNVETATELVQAGAYTGARNGDGWTPLDIAIMENKQQMIEMLEKRTYVEKISL